jgi:nucleotide-binding universal stress UspA family protein
MSMRAILVHVDEHPGLRSVLTTAWLAGKAFDSHMLGLCLRPGVPRIMPVAPEGAFIPTSELVDDLGRADREQSRRLAANFEAFMRDHEVPLGRGALAADHPSADWQDEISPGHEVLGSLGRVHDLLVVGRPLAGVAAPSMSALEAGLFESGRPLLIAPPEPPDKLGQMVVIAWNGSTETARTIALGMPFLARAEDVLVLSVEDGMVAGPTGARVANNLLRNGVAARARNTRSAGRSVGQTILEEAKAAGADLLVKGAYTNSRLRQMIFGGATSHILSTAALPVLMAH